MARKTTLSFLLTGILLIVGAILCAKRYLRGGPTEGFASTGDRCGVSLPPCPAGTRCINGYCMNDTTPKQPATTDFILVPQ